MLARFAGATLGLSAFSITVTAGLLVRNPVETTLSRSLVALLVFCLIGFVLGGAAHRVVTERRGEQRSAVDRDHRGGAASSETGPVQPDP